MMKRVYKDFLKVFLIAGLGFAITSSFTDFLFGSDDFHLMKFILNIIFFGGLMALFVVSTNQGELKKRGLEDKKIKIVNTKVVRSRKSLETLLEKIKKAYFFERHKIKEIDGGIELNSNMTGISWGERMTIKCHKLEDGLNEFEIESKPKKRFTLFDGGANYENVMMIENLLEK